MLESPVYARDGVPGSSRLWTPDSQILMTRVPWDAGYQDVVDWGSPTKLWRWLSAHSDPIVFTRAIPVYPGRPVMLDIPYDQALRYDYIGVKIPPPPAGPSASGLKSQTRYFFYFITGAEYISPNATAIYVQPDIWCTYCIGRGLKLGRGYVIRGHIGMANKSRMRDNGRAYLAVPEDMDLGSDLPIAYQERQRVADPGDCAVLVWSSVALDVDNPGTEGDPKKETATPSYIEAAPNCLGAYLFSSAASWSAAANALKNAPWITAGVQMVMLIDDAWLDTKDSTEVSVGNQRCRKIKSSQPFHNRVLKVISGLKDRIREALPEKYRGLDRLLVSPFAWIELTTHQGTPVMLRPELLSGEDLEVIEWAHVAPPGSRVAYSPVRYNCTGEQSPDPGIEVSPGGEPPRPIFTRGEDLSVATYFSSFPQYAILNDQGILTLASQAHRLSFAAEAAKAQQGMSQMSAEMNAANATIGINAGIDQSLNAAQGATAATELSNRNALLNSTLNAGGGIVSGFATGGPAGGGVAAIGGLMGVAGSALSAQQRTEMTALTNATAARGAAIGAQAGMAQRDNNMALATAATDTNYALAIGSLAAQKQDARLAQPTTAGQVGGEAFGLAVQGWYLEARIRIPAPAQLAVIGDYLLRYGYNVGRYIDLHNIPLTLMEKYTYWRISDVHLEGDFDAAVEDTIRGILGRGVTVWRDQADILRSPIYDNRWLVEVDLDAS